MPQKRNALTKARSALKKAEAAHTPRSIKQKLKQRKANRQGTQGMQTSAVARAIKK